MDFNEVAAMFEEIRDTQIDEDSLEHHGIKGMKWGVRRFQNADGSLTAAGKKRRSLGQVVRDHHIKKKRKAALEKARATKAANKIAADERARKLKEGKLKIEEMTEDEIRAAIARKNLEDSYRNAMGSTVSSASSRPATSRGKELVREILYNSAKNIGTQTVTYLLGTAVNKTVGSMVKDAAMINPKKGQKDK